ncbi:hypothetical protein ACHAXT_002814 [Thalassiosira profunda]
MVKGDVQVFASIAKARGLQLAHFVEQSALFVSYATKQDVAPVRDVRLPQVTELAEEEHPKFLGVGTREILNER